MHLRPFVSLLALCLGFLPALAPADAAQLQSISLPVVPGAPLDALVLGREGLFLGGGFASVGPLTGPGVELDVSTGVPVGPGQAFDGVVRAVAADGSGGWYVAGDFRHADGKAAFGLVHLRADGTLDPRFDARMVPDLDGGSGVDALALVGGRLYVSGRFSSIGGGRQILLAAIDPSTGTLVSQFRPSFELNIEVNAVVATPDRVYASGSFRTHGRSGLVAFSSATGALLTSFDPDQGAVPRPAEVNGLVDSLALTGNRLVVGGTFTAVGPSARNHLAALDATTGAVDSSFQPTTNAEVDALLIDGPRLFVGGRFDLLDGRPHHHLAAVNLTTGIADPGFTADADRQVLTLARTGSRLLVGGRYLTLAGTARAGLGAVNASTGAIDPAFDPAPGASVEALASQGERLYAGGDFVTTGAVPRAGLALLDPRSGRLRELSSQIPVSGPFALLPRRILVADGRPWMARVLRLRALDRRTGRLIDAFQPPDLPAGAAWAPAGVGYCAAVDRTVRCYDGHGHQRVVAQTAGRADLLSPLAIGSTLYLSGSFGRLDGQRRASLGAIDLRTGRVLRAFRPQLRSLYVTALAASRDRVYVAAKGLLVALSPHTGRVLQRYPNAGSVCGTPYCGLSIASGRLWTFENNVLRVLSVRTGELLARLDLRDRIGTIAATGSRLYVGGAFGAPDNKAPTRPNAGHPYLTAFDLRG